MSKGTGLRRRVRVPLLLLGTLLALSACEVRADLVISEDGSGTFEYSIAIENDFLEAFGKGDRDLLAEMEEKAGETPFPVETERFETADGKGVRISYTFDSIPDLEQKMASGEGKEGALITDAEITNSKVGWTFEAVGGGESPAGGVPIDADELAKIMDIRLSVTLPGPDPQGNADKTEVVGDSARFTWNLPPGTSDITLKATTNYPPEESGLVADVLEERSAGGTGDSSRFIALIALAGAAAALATFLLSRRRSVPLS